jgi:peptidoglycan hydrolase FlgJ
MTDLTTPSFSLPAAIPDVPAAVAPGTGDINPAQRSKAEQAAVKFEGLFINEMLKQMRSSAREIAGEDGLFKSQNHNSMLDMTDTMLADAMAGQRAFGIADAILQQLLPSSPPATGAALKLLPPKVALNPEKP